MRRLSPHLSVAILAILVALAAVFVLARPQRASAGSDAEAAAEARHVYNEKIAAKYNFHYGKQSPFLPSNMTTDTGEFIDPKNFPTANYCGHCHQEAHQQWRESAHSNSNRPPWYLKNVALLNDDKDKGIAFSRHCEGCHDPIAVAAGALTEGSAKKRPYDQDGITCSVCHSIQKVDTRGTGSYVLGVPAVLVDENGKPITRPVQDAEILAHLDRHSAAVMKPFYRTSEYCSSCHKAALPQTLNGYKWQRAISLYDEWQNSSFAKESPLPFYTKDSVSTCQTCHMQREALTGTDPGAKHGQLASHRWLGANTIIPQYYKFDEQSKRIAEFLKNSVFNVDVFGIERGSANPEKPNANLTAPLGNVSFGLRAGEPVVVDVVIQNKGIAHSHVPEQRDMYESWTAFTVKDSTGKVIFESGGLQPNGELEPSAHSFTNRLVNVHGTLNERHEVWNNRIVAYNNSIQSGRSQVVRYGFTIPQNATGDLTITATVKYRRFMQHFIDFALKPHYEQPIVDMVSTTRTLHLGDNHATPDLPGQNKEWMRWNNYGIALLDAQQYAASVDAFARVAKLRPDYADAYTNQAIVEIAWERYDDARPNLAKALSLSPNNARALYYRALVERNGGELDAAVADLQQVAKQFPRSRDAHRELGFSYYQQHKYPDARTEYEAVQSIDPDDLAAHYILSILYRRLGMKPEAAREAAAFADQKDDPTANTYALEYLRTHPEVANESVAWHVDALQPVTAKP
ncbi:tetratricopeptide repeat protein [Terriglobus aquaticus]|uniref:Tetratricopeptide repeat protein n=1 Tax=Terriglobus aquaticus TaxID=940139 RepID=A0ABW9KPL1_9BACT|nr:tetratricopeptide repeat protein [Terriglobus aquaticus]